MAQKMVRKLDNKVSVVNNALVNKNNITLFFCVNLMNFDMYTQETIGSHITRLYNLVASFEHIIPNTKFSIMRFDRFVSPRRYTESFLETVRLWNPDFTPSPEFLDNIQYNTLNYCMLAVNIDKTSSLEFENMEIKELVKSLSKQVVDYFAVTRQQDVDVEALQAISTKIANQGQGMLKECPSSILLEFYVKRMFPSYSLVVEDDAFDETNMVISYLKQSFTPYFNYFTMSNEGVEYFGAPIQETYGCILDILDMPEEIESEFFSLQHSGLVINAKLLDKNKARIQFKRSREDIKYEQEQAEEAGSKDADLELDDYMDLASKGIALATAGRKLAEADLHILLLANSIEDLNKKRSRLISNLKDMNILATFNGSQAKTYVESFVRMRPIEYPFLFDLRYLLSFQMNNGCMIGDGDDPKFTSPIIGETTSMSQATE